MRNSVKNIIRDITHIILVIVIIPSKKGSGFVL
jgi:hypothetical protein